MQRAGQLVMHQNSYLPRARRVLTAIDSPPIERFRRDRVWVERLLRDLDDLLWAHLRLVLSPVLRIHSRLVCNLDVQPDLVAFSRNDHTRAIVGMYRCFVADIGEVRLRNNVDDTPYEV